MEFSDSMLTSYTQDLRKLLLVKSFLNTIRDFEVRQDKVEGLQKAIDIVEDIFGFNDSYPKSEEEDDIEEEFNDFYSNVVEKTKATDHYSVVNRVFNSYCGCNGLSADVRKFFTAKFEELTKSGRMVNDRHSFSFHILMESIMKQYQEKLQKSIRDGREEHSRYKSLAVQLYKDKQYEEAVANFRKAVHLNPLDVDCYFMKAKSLFCLKNYVEAVHSLDHTLIFKPDHAGALLLLGKCQMKQKFINEAIISFKKCILHDAENQEAYDLLEECEILRIENLQCTHKRNENCDLGLTIDCDKCRKKDIEDRVFGQFGADAKSRGEETNGDGDKLDFDWARNDHIIKLAERT